MSIYKFDDEKEKFPLYVAKQKFLSNDEIKKLRELIDINKFSYQISQVFDLKQKINVVDENLRISKKKSFPFKSNGKLLDFCKGIINKINKTTEIKQSEITVGLVEDELEVIRYDKNDFFGKHQDFVKYFSNQVKCYALIICIESALNKPFVGNCVGGKTKLYLPNDKSISFKETVTAGGLLMFRNELLHEGKRVREGTKIIIKLNTFCQKNILFCQKNNIYLQKDENNNNNNKWQENQNKAEKYSSKNLKDLILVNTLKTYYEIKNYNKCLVPIQIIYKEHDDRSSFGYTSSDSDNDSDSENDENKHVSGTYYIMINGIPTYRYKFMEENKKIEFERLVCLAGDKSFYEYYKYCDDEKNYIDLTKQLNKMYNDTHERIRLIWQLTGFYCGDKYKRLTDYYYDNNEWVKEKKKLIKSIKNNIEKYEYVIYMDQINYSAEILKYVLFMNDKDNTSIYKLPKLPQNMNKKYYQYKTINLNKIFKFIEKKGLINKIHRSIQDNKQATYSPILIGDHDGSFHSCNETEYFHTHCFLHLGYLNMENNSS